MKPITETQWEAYRLTHPDHQGMSVAKAADELGVTVAQVRGILEPLVQMGLFIDISSEGRRFDHGVVRYGTWADGEVKQKF